MLRGLLRMLPALPLCSVAMAQGPASMEWVPATPTSLWVAESDSVTLYLLGSIHVLRESDFPLDPRMDRAFDEAEMVLLETAIDSLGDSAVEERMLEVALLPDGTTLDEVVPEETFRRAEEASRQLGLDPRAIQPLRPVTVAITLSMLDFEKEGFSESGIDEYFYRRAEEKGVPIAYFETVEEQLDLLFRISPELDAQFLTLTLEQLDSSETESARMMDAWKHGDDEELDRLLNEAMAEMPTLRDRLLVERNHRWMDRLDTWLERNKDLLIVVGAGHLVGDEGLVRLLEKRGFRLRQL